MPAADGITLDRSGGRTVRLRHRFVEAHGLRTALVVWPDNGLPPAMLLPGLTGTYRGLIPLAREAVHTRPILVDLPGHGDTDVPTWWRQPDLRAWFADVHAAVAADYGAPALVVAHSFACLTVPPGTPDVTFVCPVPAVQPVTMAAARVLRRALRLPALTEAFNEPLGSALRDLWMVKRKTWATWRELLAMDREEWRITPGQRSYQAGLTRVMTGPDQFAGVAPRRVVVVDRDVLAGRHTARDMAARFPDAELIVLDSGHLVVIEDAPTLASTIGL
ncbi:MAG: alpha/beta fold hydrolase [Actinomycetia bacterium]|nr:alpha/beta fold hydrolase [Actinomycetes bacterium]